MALGALVLDEAFNLRIAAGMPVVLIGVGMTRRREHVTSAAETPAALAASGN